MILGLIFAAAAFIAPTQATFDDQSDEDFAAFMKFHDDVRVEYGESFGRGCVAGALPAAPAGFAALCIGCAVTGASNVAADAIFPERKKD